MNKIIRSKAFLISIIAVIVIGIAAAIIILSGKNNTRESSGRDGSKSTVTSNSEAGKPKIKRKSYPVGKWDLPVPFINPFGSQENYQQVEYIPNQYTDLAYIGMDNMETTRITCGESWTMSYDWQDQTMSPLEDIRLYMEEINGEVYPGTSWESEFIIHATDKDGIEWWGRVGFGGGYRLTVYKEFELKADTPITLKTDDYENNNVYFVTNHPGDRFQTLAASFLEGEVSVRAWARYTKGSYYRDIDFGKQLYGYKTTKYILDNIPQEASTPLLWEISWDSGTNPREITFSLEYGDKLNPVKYGERLGALTVKGAAFGNVRVEPSSSVNVSHPEYAPGSNPYGDITPEGDTIFYLPSGYWNVLVDGMESEVTYCAARLIPVNEGEITVLNIPPNAREAYANTELGAPGEHERGLKILETMAQGSQASVTFLMMNSENPDMIPTLSNTEITEGGTSGRLISVERVQTPPSVVLALDSSGSMRGQMENVVEAARTFIEGLPDDAFIQVIDFDTSANVLKGTTKSEVLKSLGTIKAGGATALYDSTLRGLELLEGKQRPTLVVFTDGVDANIDDTGPGSMATKEEVMEKIYLSNISVYAIGFGPNHDNKTLLEMAGISGGMYYPAQDKTALDNVFYAINNKLGSIFKATYERPEEAAPADVPVISLVIDTSGSMDYDPAEEGCGYRIDKVKNLYHDFINRIPEDSQIQLIRFSEDVSVEQLPTNNKAELLQALGELSAGMGTDIYLSTKVALEGLKHIPSNKRVIVYLTDLALDVHDKQAHERILSEIKQEGIQSLWVGLGVEESADVFAWVAEQSGGKYVISEDPDELNKALDELLRTIQSIPADKLTLSLSVRDDSARAGNDEYSASLLVDFPLPEKSGKKITLNTLSYQTGTKLIQYDKEMAQIIYGSSIPGKEVTIFKQIPLEATGKNKAMEWTAKKAYFMRSLRGVEAPVGKCFMAIDMEMKNITAESIPYLIPDIASHFFTTINNNGSYPASTATWLAEKPLVIPGKTELMIKSGETARGILIFIVPEVKTEQASLHFYDTMYGHITLPLIGSYKKQEIALEEMPKYQEGKLSETFSLSIKAAKDLTKIEKIDPGENSVFKVLEGELNSKVQAILDIYPHERFSLKIHTTAGPLMAPLNPSTALLPFGFFRPVTLAPGSSNKIRFSFQVPTAIKNARMELFGDLSGGALVLPVNNGTPFSSASKGVKYDGDGMSITVNSLARINELPDRSGYLVVADITVTDLEDGFGTMGFVDSFTLVREGYDPSAEEQLPMTAGAVGLGSFASGTDYNIIYPDEMTNDLLFGISGDFVVFDGESRRGFVLFDVPADSYEEGWILTSPYFPTLNLLLAAGSYNENDFKDNALLVKQLAPDADESFNESLSIALSKVISEYQAIQAANPTSGTQFERVSVDASKKNPVPVPIATVDGSLKMNAVDTMAKFQSVMDQLKWVPSSDPYATNYRYSPEAVLTQGWGTEGDLANLAGKLLAKLGYRPSPKYIKVTDAGREALKELGKLDECSTGTIAGWSYTDEQGNHKVFVVPFMKDLSELSGLVYLSGGSTAIEVTPVFGTVDVSFALVPTEKSVASTAGDIADILGGGGTEDGEEYTEEVRVLSADLPLSELSKDAVDIRIVGKEKYYTALLETRGQLYLGNQYIDSAKYRVKSVIITVTMPDGAFSHETSVGEGDDLTGIFHTLGINLPDLPEEALKTLQKAADNEYKAAKKPDEMSALHWYTRGILNKFITAQTSYEKQLSEELEITTGRSGRERCIVVTVRRKDSNSPLLTSIDLLQYANQVHSGPEEALYAFNIMSGLFASRLEGVVLPGNKADFMDIWEKGPADSGIFLSTLETRSNDLEYMKQNNYPKSLIKRAETNNKAMLIPAKPSMIDGKERWAWLEIDEVTFETISVLDTGERGSFAEYLMALEPVVPNGEDYREFMVGAFLGIDTAIWATASFSLSMDDYDEILKAAKAYSYGLCDYLDQVMTGTGAAKLEFGAGPVKIKIVGEIDFDHMVKYFEEISTGKTIGGGQNYLGFSDGFKSGVAYYFKQAEKSAGQ